MHGGAEGEAPHNVRRGLSEGAGPMCGHHGGSEQAPPHSVPVGRGGAIGGAARDGGGGDGGGGGGGGVVHLSTLRASVVPFWSHLFAVIWWSGEAPMHELKSGM
jgi:hypothetical protein